MCNGSVRQLRWSLLRGILFFIQLAPIIEFACGQMAPFLKVCPLAMVLYVGGGP